jgi:hypothetical protein
MPYPFQKHWYCFTDIGEVYQNVFENLSGLSTQWQAGDDQNPSLTNIKTLVDPIVDGYKSINAQIGVDYDGTNPDVYNKYIQAYTSSLSVTSKNVLIVLGTIEAGLLSNLISTPILKLHGAVSTNTQGILAKAESVVSDVAHGTGTILENLGQGIVNTSGALANLPLIIGVGVIAYYFLMVAPKSKAKG